MICFLGTHTVAFDFNKIAEALNRALGDSMAKERNNRLQQYINAILSDDSTYLDAYEAMRAEEMARHLNQQPFIIKACPSDWKKMKWMESVQAVRQRAHKQRRACSSERLPQSDIKSISLHASQPVPPTIIMKGGYQSVLIKGV